MRSTFIASVWLFLVPVASPGAEEISSLMEQANAAHLAKDFEKAAGLYEKILETSGPAPGVLYNLGNARCRLGAYGPAILAYEQALAVEPRAADIRQNLKLAREAAAAFEDSAQAKRWMEPLRGLSLNEWALVGAAALGILAVASLVRGFVDRSGSWAWLRWLTGGSALVLFVSVAALGLRHSEYRRAIVLTPDAAVRLSPFPTADVVGTLTAGRAVQVEGRHGEFFRIDGGWLAKSDAGMVLEPPAR